MMNEMKTTDYKSLYQAIVDMSVDMDSVGLFDKITAEDIEKAKWIACILACINDVPLRRMNHIFSQKRIDFDIDDFLDENFY